MSEISTVVNNQTDRLFEITPVDFNVIKEHLEAHPGRWNDVDDFVRKAIVINGSRNVQT